MSDEKYRCKDCKNHNLKAYCSIKENYVPQKSTCEEWKKK
uniref:Uncharacterized protein n=1 Tax=viral metagenome TaxID=1070528 RepID=A0A6M3Y493_9ZZZZ